MGIRRALGADRRRLTWNLLTESLLLSIGGGVVGIGIAVVEADAELRSLYVLFTDGRFAGYYWYGVRLQGEDLP